MMGGFLSRMGRYLNEMFPLGRHLVMSALIYLSVAYFARSLNSVDLSVITWHTLIGIGSVFGLFLLLRLMDELKDYDLDSKLFPDRPICTGMVKHEDIRIGLWIVTISLLATNLFAGDAFWSALVLVAYAYLMFWHFFARDALRASLPLTLLTHQPIIPLLLVHCQTVLADEQQIPWHAWNWRLVAPFIVLMWMPFLGWEISRKIRAPADETEYVTYSRLFGPRRATLVAIFVETIPMIAAVYLDRSLQLPGLYLLMMIGMYLSYLFACIPFLLSEQRTAKHLKRSAEIYLAGVLVAQIVTFGFLPWG